MAYKQTPEERDAGLVCIGEIYQSIDSAEGEVYLRMKTEHGMTAYLFKNPHNLVTRIMKYADRVMPLDCEDVR